MIVLTDAQWFCLCPFLHSCFGIYVGNETRGRLCVAARCGCLLASVAGRVRERELGLSPLSTGAIRAYGRAGWPQAKPELSAERRDSTVVRARRARPKKGRDPALGHSRGGFRTQIHSLAQWGRPLCLRLTGGPRPDRTQGRGLNRRAPALPDRRPDL